MATVTSEQTTKRIPTEMSMPAVDVVGSADFLGAGGDPLEGAVEEDAEGDGLEEVSAAVAVDGVEGEAQGVVAADERRDATDDSVAARTR